MPFTGIPAEAFDFYDALAADNSKPFWTEHKDEYEAYVREPMRNLADALEPRFGLGHLYRPYRDVRFSKDKTPYKDHQGLFVPSRNGLGWYVQLNARGLMAAGGWYTSTSEQVRRYREAVDGDEGGSLQGLLNDACSSGLQIGGEKLKTRPRGVAADHPRLDLLRHRSLFLSRTWPPEMWMGTSQVLELLSSQWEAMVPAMDWLADAAGPGDPPIGSGARTARA